MIHIFLKELNAYFNALIAYLVIAVFLTGIGLITWVFPETSILEYGYADMDTLFSLGPYVLMFLIPAVTMKAFAEEKRSGTLEFLFTKPIRDWHIILGKFASVLTVVLIALLPTSVYYISIYLLGSPVGNIDSSGVVGSYIGLIGLGAVFCAIGLFSSSLTKSQIVAFIVASFLCFILYSGFNSLSTLSVWGDNHTLIEQMGILYHYQSLSKGLLDSRNLVYFGSVVIAMLSFTKLIIGARKW